MQDKIHNILNSFQSVSLAEMDSVKLMDRTDSRYVFNAERLSHLLQRLESHYRVLEVKGKKISRYETLYYDTPDMELYHRHQVKRGNRYKIRARNYVESDLSFFEIKLKNQKKRTIKSRIKVDRIYEELSGNLHVSDYLTLKTGYSAEQMTPQLWVNYERITLVSLENKERCTIDLNLNFVKGGLNQDYSFMVILELKQEKCSSGYLSSIMKEMSIREGGISKYCLGVISLNPTVRHNNFKPKLLNIKKLRTQ